MRRLVAILMGFSVAACTTVEPTKPLLLAPDNPVDPQKVDVSSFEKAVVKYQGANGEFYQIKWSEKLAADMSRLNISSARVENFEGVCTRQEPGFLEIQKTHCRIIYKIDVDGKPITGGIYKKLTYDGLGQKEIVGIASLRSSQSSGRTLKKMKELYQIMITDIQAQILE